MLRRIFLQLLSKNLIIARYVFDVHVYPKLPEVVVPFQFISVIKVFDVFRRNRTRALWKIMCFLRAHNKKSIIIHIWTWSMFTIKRRTWPSFLRLQFRKMYTQHKFILKCTRLTSSRDNRVRYTHLRCHTPISVCKVSFMKLTNEFLEFILDVLPINLWIILLVFWTKVITKKYSRIIKTGHSFTTTFRSTSQFFVLFTNKNFPRKHVWLTNGRRFDMHYVFVNSSAIG